MDFFFLILVKEERRQGTRRCCIKKKRLFSLFQDDNILSDVFPKKSVQHAEPATKKTRSSSKESDANLSKLHVNSELQAIKDKIDDGDKTTLSYDSNGSPWAQNQSEYCPSLLDCLSPNKKRTNPEPMLLDGISMDKKEPTKTMSVISERVASMAEYLDTMGLSHVLEKNDADIDQKSVPPSNLIHGSSEERQTTPTTLFVTRHKNFAKKKCRVIRSNIETPSIGGIVEAEKSVSSRKSKNSKNSKKNKINKNKMTPKNIFENQNRYCVAMIEYRLKFVKKVAQKNCFRCTRFD
ncbi:hypothetical protein RFI_13394 [Reticulomyxa filosa]|uniref:Uncharacterized protein n=1 Tax=Reticulomyxa filosa TaxID=46433 RepID=X6NDD9_RETFI|nr:hypothetical protein RFI_13394 [Reticulomyxa filosa]|eukprot:ETO23784.1 hypothetical protein RFI_13394 [Reticulomyxa filosa]